MVEIISWIGVALIALGALVGFVGVVATSLVGAVRLVRERGPRPATAHARSHASLG